MSDQLSFLSSPLASAVLGGAVVGTFSILVALVNKWKRPVELNLDIQQKINDGFKVLLDGYEKQATSLKAEVEDNQTTIDELSAQVDSQEIRIRDLISERDQALLLNATLTEQKRQHEITIISQAERLHLYRGCPPPDQCPFLKPKH